MSKPHSILDKIEAQHKRDNRALRKLLPKDGTRLQEICSLNGLSIHSVEKFRDGLIDTLPLVSMRILVARLLPSHEFGLRKINEGEQ